MAFNLMKMLGLQSKKPDIPSVQSFYDPRVGEYSDILSKFAKDRLSPDYNAVTPEQQGIIYNRIKSTLQPTFDEGIQSQLQNIQSMGIEGSPGASILSRLRKDYANDLSGRATDLAIKNIEQTSADRGTGVDILGNLRSQLLNEAATNYGTTVNANNQQQQNDSALWQSIGNIGGNLALSYLSPQASLSAELLSQLRKNGTGTSKGLKLITGAK